MMAHRWSYSDTMKLIELYKSFDFLWDKDSVLYTNATARKQAYEKIVSQIQIPCLSAQDIRCKIKNLRTTYYQEIRRKDRHVSKKLVWFEALTPIMNKVYTEKRAVTHPKKRTLNASFNVLRSQEINSESEESKNEMEVPDDSYTIVEENVLPEPTTTLDTYVVSIKQEYLDEMESRDNAAVSDYLEPVNKRTKYTEDNENYEEPETFHKNKKVDEFQMFANNIAAQLRKLPLDRALNIQVDVQSMIAKERIHLYQREKDVSHQED